MTFSFSVTALQIIIVWTWVQVVCSAFMCIVNIHKNKPGTALANFALAGILTLLLLSR